MKGITCCADCACYDWKKKRCGRVKGEPEPQGHFFAECPLPDAVPVVHGYWIDKINNLWQAYSHDKCSVCGWWNTRDARCYVGRKGHSLNYCPNCGAKMDGKEKPPKEIEACDDN